MPKPEFPDWDLNQTNQGDLTTGHIDDGYAHNEIPTSDELNTWMWMVGQWFRWLDEGDVNLTRLALPSTDLTISTTPGVITAASDTIITRLIGGGSGATIQGIVDADDGRVVVLVNATGSAITVNVQDFADAPPGQSIRVNDVTAGATVRFPPGAAIALRYDRVAAFEWSVLWSSCSLVSATSIVPVPFLGAARLSNCGYVTNIERIQSTAANWEFGSISHGAWGLRAGDRILKLAVHLIATSAGSYTFNLAKRDSAGNSTITSTFSASGTGGFINTVFTVTSPVAIAEGERWYIDVLGPNASDVMTDLHVEYDHVI